MERFIVISALLVIAIAFLVLAQGGFFPLASCAVGCIACVVAGIVWLRKPHRTDGLPIIPLLFLGMALAYAASALASGTSLTTLSETGVWTTCAGAAFLAAAQDPQKRAFWTKVLAWFGVATAIAGVFVCSGLIPLVGGMVGARLQFTFQYANAAAAWYGICAFLCLLSPDERLRAAAALPIAALLLTESGGGTIVFALAFLAVCLHWVRAAQWNRLFESLVQLVLAAALFLATHATMSPLTLLPLAVAIVACWWLHKGFPLIEERLNTRIASFVLAGIALVSAIAVVLLLPDRIADALSSIGERSHHVQDGLSLWLTQPILGVGPDNWQYLYQYIQSAPYYTTVVHCSYIQILLDAGAIGLIFFAAACILGVRALIHNWKDGNSRNGWAGAELMAVLFLLAHSALDFDMQFTSLALALVALLSAPQGPRSNGKGLKGLIASLLCLIVCLPICAAGLLCASSSMAIDLAETSGDYAMCEKLFEGNLLAQSDVAAQSHYLASLYGEERYDDVVNVYSKLLAPTDRDTLLTALSCYYNQDRSQATAILIERLENHPYDSEFLSDALTLTGRYGIDQTQAPHFDFAVQNAKTLMGLDG